jgi:DDE superfamily endonuclease
LPVYIPWNWCLFAKIEGLPTGYICIGDCAYQPTENLVPIFGGDLALKKHNDAFNYYASQLRIRIEMAFGLMTRKWGILQRPLSNALFSIKHLICCIARLHNFCIDERLKTAAVTSSLSVDTRESLSFTQLAYMNAAAQVCVIENMN